MASNTINSRTSSQDLYSIIQSLTGQLEKSDKALVDRENQYRSQIKALEKELHTAREQKDATVATCREEKEALLAELTKETAQRQDVEHRLATGYQAAQNAQRELKQAQDSLALANKHHASSIAQALKEVDSWKEQARTNLEHVNGRLQSQSQQIDNLMIALNQHMTNQFHLPQSQLPPLRVYDSSYGPPITIPMPKPRPIKEEASDQEDSGVTSSKYREYDDDMTQDEEDDKSESSHTVFVPGQTRRRSERSRSRPPPRRANRGRQPRGTDDVGTEGYSDEEADEMAIGYDDTIAHSAKPHVKDPRTPGRRHDQSSAKPLITNRGEASQRNMTVNSSPLKTPQRHPTSHNRQGSMTGPRDQTRVTVKKRRVG